MTLTKDMKNIVEEGIAFVFEVHCYANQGTVWVCAVDRDMLAKSEDVSSRHPDFEQNPRMKKIAGPMDLDVAGEVVDGLVSAFTSFGFNAMEETIPDA